MKRLLFSLTLALTVVASSCGNDTYSAIHERNVIHSIEVDSEGCSYYGNGYMTGVYTSTSFRLIDTCGKFNIGDTIRLTK